MRACLTVDLKALKHNLKLLSTLTQRAKGFFCPVIKANAYGHGALEVGELLCSAGIRQAGVVSVEEALELRGLAGDMDIYILGPCPKDQMPCLGLYGFIPLVGGWKELEALADFSSVGKKPVSFHLKFNTGMNRFGFLPSERAKVLAFIQKHEGLKLKGLASHLSDGEKAGSQKGGSAFQQVQSFKNLSDFFKNALAGSRLDIHLLNSAGWFALFCHNLTEDLSLGFRPGIALYGVKPPVDFLSSSAKKKYGALPLKPVACLKSFVVRSYRLSHGERVSYGGEWRATGPSTLAVVSLGYADGMPYRLFKGGEVLFRGRRAPIAGRICMDFFMIDVTQQAREGAVRNGEEVVVFGRQKNHFISVEEQVEKAGSIPEEFLTRIGPRVQKIYKNG